MIAAHLPELRKKVYAQLKRNKIDVINVLELQNQLRPSCASVDFNSFSSASREFRRRALLETECRLFGNLSESVGEETNVETSINLTQREKAALVLDKRTFLQPVVLMNDDDCKNTISTLREFCVAFCAQSKCHERKNQNIN